MNAAHDRMLTAGIDDDPRRLRAESDESTRDIFAAMIGDEMEDVAACFWTWCATADDSPADKKVGREIKQRARAVKARAIEQQVRRYDMEGV